MAAHAMPHSVTTPPLKLTLQSEIFISFSKTTTPNARQTLYKGPTFNFAQMVYVGGQKPPIPLFTFLAQRPQKRRASIYLRAPFVKVRGFFMLQQCRTKL